jgi:hypothetical protein
MTGRDAKLETLRVLSAADPLAFVLYRFASIESELGRRKAILRQRRPVYGAVTPSA